MYRSDSQHGTVDRIRRGQLDSRWNIRSRAGYAKTVSTDGTSLALSRKMQPHRPVTSDLRETLEQMEIQNVELDSEKARP